MSDDDAHAIGLILMLVIIGIVIKLCIGTFL